MSPTPRVSSVSAVSVQGSLVLTLQQNPSDSDTLQRSCIVYSISHHPKHPCLLSAASTGSVKVWKPKDWEAS